MCDSARCVAVELVIWNALVVPAQEAKHATTTSHMLHTSLMASWKALHRPCSPPEAFCAHSINDKQDNGTVFGHIAEQRAQS